MRTTAKDVRAMFGRAMRAAQANGIDVTGWSLYEAHATYELNMRPYGSLGIGFVGNHLGSTHREACSALLYMARAWELTGEILPRQAALAGVNA